MTAKVPHSDQATIEANGINIVYDTFGDSRDPPMLLIMGLGCQMIDWRDEFCSQLAVRGYWVIRFDNRDIGLSTKFFELGLPDISAMLKLMAEGGEIQFPYTMGDMADDAIGLLDALGIEVAHVVGLSMGGSIAQLMAIHYPERLITLTSVMSSTGEPDLPRATEEALALLTEPTPMDREGYIEYRVEHRNVLGGPKYPMREDLAREHAGRRYDRSFYPIGFARQLAAILATPGRREALGSVNIPTLVIHGDADPLVPVECGIDTAKSVPGAKQLIIEGMGHDSPPSLWPQMVTAITEHAVN